MHNKIINIVLVVIILALLIWIVYLLVRRGKSTNTSEAFQPEQELRLIKVGTPLISPARNESFQIHQELNSEMHNVPTSELHGMPTMPGAMQNMPRGPIPSMESKMMLEEQHVPRLPLQEQHAARLQLQEPTGAIAGDNTPKFGMPGAGASQEASQVDFGKPFVDARTNALFGGPGYEPIELQNRFGEPVGPIPADYYMLDDGASQNLTLVNNLCSRDCCSPQWPVPFKTKSDPYICKMKEKGELVPSQYFCNNTFQDAGCMCMTREQGNFLFNRGGNGPSLF